MCFAPQGRALFQHLNFQKWSENGVFCAFWLRNVSRGALFRHLNFQKWSEHGVLCTFWLGHVFRATTACNFSSLIWPELGGGGSCYRSRWCEWAGHATNPFKTPLNRIEFPNHLIDINVYIYMWYDAYAPNCHSDEIGHTLWESNIAIENQQFLDYCPMKTY